MGISGLAGAATGAASDVGAGVSGAGAVANATEGAADFQSTLGALSSMETQNINNNVDLQAVTVKYAAATKTSGKDPTQG